jgi:predicted Zn-dependent peptidase
LNMDYIQKTFKNGLNVFMMPSQQAESVFFNILVKVGSRYETLDVAGVSHFLEHLFFKGSQSYPNPTDISQIVDSIGGDFNAATSKETTEYYIKAEKHHFELIFDVLTDMLLNPLFNPDEIEKEKGVVIEEINQYQDAPASEVENRLEQGMWPTSALGRDILGTKESIRALSREQIFAYKEKYYQPSNIILGISGNFNPDVALAKVEKTWAQLEDKKVPKLPQLREKQVKPNLSIENKKTQQAHLALGFRSYRHDHPKNVATYLLANILGGSMSSRLFVNIREQKGLAYYIGAGNSPYFHTGNFTIHAGLRISDTQAALVEILAELRRIRTDIVSEVELKRAKDYIKGKMALSHENIHRKIDWIVDHYAFAGRIRTIEEFYGNLEKVTPKDIQKIAKEIFTNDRMTLALIGPFKNKKVFEKELHLKGDF